jgi:hypothetical protein
MVANLACCFKIGLEFPFNSLIDLSELTPIINLPPKSADLARI